MEKTEKPNWDKWRNMLEVVLWEAVALSLDVEPAYLDSRDEIHSRHRQPKQYKDEKDFNDRYDVAESHMGIGKPLRPGSILPRAHRAGISLAEFSAWALSINWEIPQELADLAKERSQSSTQSSNENKVEQKKSLTGKSPQYGGQTIFTTDYNSDFPLDTKWEDMTWIFLTNEMVKIEANGVTNKYLYSDLGFKDMRKGDVPTTRWTVLRVFAENNGEISWETNIDNKLNNKMPGIIRDISKKLKEAFGINDNPFHNYKKEKSYKTKFLIKDERENGDTVNSQPEGFGEDAIKQHIEEQGLHDLQQEVGRTNTKYDEEK